MLATIYGPDGIHQLRPRNALPSADWMPVCNLNQQKHISDDCRVLLKVTCSRTLVQLENRNRLNLHIPIKIPINFCKDLFRWKLIFTYGWIAAIRISPRQFVILGSVFVRLLFFHQITKIFICFTARLKNSQVLNQYSTDPQNNF